MEITLKELALISGFVDANGIPHTGSLDKLLTKELPVKAAYKLGRLSKSVAGEMEQYQQHKNNLIKKYGKEKDGTFSIESSDTEAINNFLQDNEELLSVKIKLDYEPISIEELGSINITPIDMGKLDMFIKG
ncbi:MAG: hypothetical protein R6W90_15295 [Ignavibacteriaceae bacterium]